MVESDIQFVEVPKRLRKYLGDPDPETRMFRQIGRKIDFEEWWDAVSEICAPHGAMSPGGASMIAKVSRMGVYKRMKEGRITAFMFYLIPEHARWSVWDLLQRHKGPAACYIPVGELKEWARVIEEQGRARWGSEEPVDDDFLNVKRAELRKVQKERCE